MQSTKSISRCKSYQIQASRNNLPSKDEYSKTDSYKQFYCWRPSFRYHRSFAWVDLSCLPISMVDERQERMSSCRWLVNSFLVGFAEGRVYDMVCAYLPCLSLYCAGVYNCKSSPDGRVNMVCLLLLLVACCVLRVASCCFLDQRLVEK